MRTSIQFKILPLVVVCVLLLSGIFFYVLMRTATENLERDSMKEIQDSKKTFLSIQDEEIKILKTAIIALSNDQGIKEAFLSEDREALYNRTKALHTSMKDESSITHLIFYTPEQLFLRVHSPELYGEETITRYVANKSVKSGSWGIGLEVGSRGSAQRVSYPYYDDGALIGYIEAGVEVTPFMNTMKSQSDDDYVMLGFKRHFDQMKWSQTREAMHLRDNYGDFQEYVVLGSTDETYTTKDNPCFDEEQLSMVSYDGKIIDYFEKDGRHYVCGGFILLESEENRDAIGVMVVIKDITQEIMMTDQAKRMIISVTLIITIIASLLQIALLHVVVISPLKKLTRSAKEIGNGNIHAEIPKIRTKDEMRQLADTLETVVGAVKYLKKKQK